MTISDLLKTNKTVFTTVDLMKIGAFTDMDYLYVLILRMIKRGELIRIRKGIYTYTQNYNRFELANKLKAPSYVSLERVLFDSHVIFQDYSQKITSVSNNTYEMKIEDVIFSYNKIQNAILMNPLGVIIDGNVRMATPERAICDMLYIAKSYYFDYLKNIDKKKLYAISHIYNKRVIKEIRQICSI